MSKSRCVTTAMNDEQLLRYSRQILLPKIGTEGQARLLAGRVLLVGAGGLGSPVAMYLAAAGIGTLAIADHDQVELSNLQRQILYRQEDLGIRKVDSAGNTIRALNPDVSVITLDGHLQGEPLREQVRLADAVVDCSDNFATRFAVNEACVRHRTPLISGAAIRMEGQLTVFKPGKTDSPCYRCLYKEGEDPEQTCVENGVLGPVVGVIGSLQALETIKVLLDLGDDLCGRLLLFDGAVLEWRTVKLRRDPGCPVCGKSS
ncbi:MAG: molybdopterin-synthase adenylyltransferase MoeB [Gammaproteobacteria bacterium]